MFIKKVILLAVFVLPLAACDSKKPQTDASSYKSQSEILDMQEEEFAKDQEGTRFEDKQEEEVLKESKDSGTIDNTSSEADDTVY